MNTQGCIELPKERVRIWKVWIALALPRQNTRDFRYEATKVNNLALHKNASTESLY